MHDPQFKAAVCQFPFLLTSDQLQEPHNNILLRKTDLGFSVKDYDFFFLNFGE